MPSRCDSNVSKNFLHRTLLWLGLGFFFAWFWDVTQNPTMLLFASDDGTQTSILWVYILGGAAVSLLFITLLIDTVGSAKLPGKIAFFLIAHVQSITFIALGAYALALYFPLLSQSSIPGGYEIGAITVGIVAALLFTRWGTVVGKEGPHRVISSSAGALLVATALTFVFYQLETGIADACIALFPFASAGFLSCMPSLHGSIKSQEGEGDASDALRRSSAIKFLVSVFVLGVACGLLYFLFSTVTLEKCNDPYCIFRFLNGSFLSQLSTNDFYGVVSVIGLALAACIIIITSRVMRLNFRKLIYAVGFPLIALGFLVIAFDPGLKLAQAISHASAVNFTCGRIISISGYYYVLVISWALCSYLSRSGRENAPRLYASMGAALCFGQTLGFLLSNLLEIIEASRADSCMIALFALMLTSLAIVTNDKIWNDWGGVRPNEPDQPSLFRIACQSVARVGKLTPREQEVLALLARGRNMSVIAETLVVSKDTAKTHCRSIYRKLGVHSQQELIDLIEREIRVDRDQRQR